MTTLVGAPVRADGVQLIGGMVGSGYRTPPSLVRRGDGQVLQLTPLLYLVLEATDGRRGYAEIAEAVGTALGRTLTPADVQTLVDGHLRPLGLVRPTDGSDPAVKRADPLLGLKPRFAITDARTTRRLTDPFRVLFRPAIIAVVMISFVAVVGWVFFERGLGASAYDAFERPHLLVLVFVVSVLSGGFHEFGHAAAARAGGSDPGVMGAGLYLVWPAFFTDVTDSYRLSRGGRLRTDLGGLYFNAVVAVLTFVWWWVSGWEALLLLVAVQVLQMAQQLLPLLRFDGYHVLADIAGVPDLYHRIRPTLLGLLPHRWKSPENRVLTPWARATITFWVLVTVPMMALMLFALVAAVPRLVGTAGSAIGKDVRSMGAAWGDGELLDVAGHTLQGLGVLLSVLACALVLGRVGIRWFRGLAVWSQDSRGRRVVAVAASATLLTGLSWAWWPHPGSYEPIAPGERNIFAPLLPGQPASADAAASLPRPAALATGAVARDRLAGDRPLVAAFQEGDTLPTKNDPQLAMVLVPREGTDGGSGSAGETPDDTWVFPFDKPLPPQDGDNQALAVATEDGAVTYDVAFAMVWVEDDEVLNVNEAHAYASCSDCVAVAVAFQVVLIMDDAHVVVPQNLAVAANYDCYRCITAAIANQLVLSVETEPGEEQLLALGQVWSQLVAFANEITSHTLTEIMDQLEATKAEIAAILTTTPPPQAPPTPTVAAATPTEPAGRETTAPDTPAPTPDSAPATDQADTPAGDPEPAAEETADPTPAEPETTEAPEPVASSGP